MGRRIVGLQPARDGAVQFLQAIEASMTGRTISHYRILDNLGEGGMGDVHEAGDTGLDRTVAVKFIKGGLGERFEREARGISSLNHPNIRARLPRPAIHVALNWRAGLAG